MMYELIPRFSRKPLFSQGSGVFAFVMLGMIGFASWGHHMYSTGMDFTTKVVFMIGTLAAVPASGMHVFNFLATMWGGRIKFAAPMLFAVGGIALFFSAGAGGVLNSAMPLDFISHGTYWVVGHMHLFLTGTIAFGFVGMVYYMFPFITGRMYSESLGKWHFWLTMIGFNVTFMSQFFLGIAGMPRRIPDYALQFANLNMVSSMGAFLLGASQLLLVYNVMRSWRGAGKKVTAAVWEGAKGLEFTLPSPPPYHTFETRPVIQ